MKARAALLALGVLAACAGPAPGPRTAPAATTDQVALGRALFQDKGCVTCHRNGRSGGTTLYRGYPNLTDYRNDAAFLRRWLADPRAVKPGTIMPDLGLSPEEIDALIAFLNVSR